MTVFLKCKWLFFMAFLTVAGGFPPPAAEAHGTGYRVVAGAGAVAAEFFYSDKEPMKYAEVLVFSPQDEKLEHQNGRTDRNDRFAFYPDAPGSWRIDVSDGMGHLQQGHIEVMPSGDGSAGARSHRDGQSAQPVAATTGVKTLLGLSLLMNVTAALYFFKRRRPVSASGGP